MAPFKFSKKSSKEKAKQEPVPPEATVPAKPQPKSQSQPQAQPQAKPPAIPPHNPKRFMQGEKPSISSVPEALATRIYPTPVPSQQRNVSSASALQQADYTPWHRVKLSNSPFPRYRHVASSYTSDQNQIFVIGGLHDQSVYGDTWIISALDEGTKLSSKTIEITESTPPPRVGHASTLCGNAFVTFGGDTHKVNSEGLMDDDVYLFNINSYKWTIPKPVGPRPLGRYGHKISVIATSQLKTKLYVFGGQFDDTYFNDLAVFDLSSFRRPDSRWQFVKPYTFTPPPLTNHTMVSYDFKLWVFGGDTPQGLINDLFLFDPLLNDWRVVQTTGEKPPPVQEHAAVLYGDLMCIVGGKDEQDIYSNDVYFLNMISLKWFKLPLYKMGIPQGRSGHSLTLLPNNKLLIMGGDKFDYSRPDDADFHTSEVDMGCGTILYLLDLTRLRENCPGIYDAVRTDGSRKMREPNTASSQLQNRILSGQQQNILTPFTERYQTPKTEQGGFIPAENHSSPNNDKTVDPQPVRKDQSAADLQAPHDMIKPTSPIPQLKTTQWGGPHSPPPRVVSLSSGNDSELGTSRGHDSQLSYETGEEYGVALVGNSPSRPVVRESIIPESETLENLRDRTAPEDITPKREDFKEAASTPEQERARKLPNETPAQAQVKNVTKDMIDALRVELGELRSEAEKNARSASQRIKELETENDKLKESGSAGSRLVRLQTDFDIAVADKKVHEDRVNEMEDLLSKKFLDVARLHDIIRVQSNKLSTFDDNEIFREKHEELTAKHEQLLKEHEALKAQDREQTKSLHATIEQYNVQLEEFISFKKRGDQAETAAPISDHHQKVINDLRSNLEKLTVEKEANETSRVELSQSLKDLQDKHQELEATVKKLEQNYESSLNSVNYASRALELSQDDLNKYKQENKRLADELEELKYKSNDRRDVSITSNDESIMSVGGGAVGSDSRNDMRDAPYRLKIKDLKAELFIIKQERDSLNENLMELKKKLLNLENEED
ncbi:LAME_0E01244g1_1 [Lachancea meyersii CBS 8951]|uniref:LAME_0E01244g1_1 n=1 Tax=Lachancea meyersii CBS 8951 TaxID=1266667 RepID=A0A1G4JFI1_9SACH|nr:LAME_0E01244g1_1 [Lachancea meyersii CBS 8951]